MTVHISRVQQEVFSVLYRQAHEVGDMAAGAEDVRLRDQRRQQAAWAAKIKAKGMASSPMIITNRTSSLRACPSDEAASIEAAKGEFTSPNSNTADNSTVSAHESLSRNLAQEAEHLKGENRRQEDKIQYLNKSIKDLNQNIANLKKTLEFKKEECVHLTSQVEQREKAIEEGEKRFNDEQARYQRESGESNEECDAERSRLQARIDTIKAQKEHLSKSLEEINIEKVSAYDKCNAETEKRQELEAALAKMDEERQSLQTVIGQMKDEKERRESEVNHFVKTAKSQRKTFEAEIERLTAQGNRLVAQNSRRRTHVPAEDESKVIDAFYALHDGVRCWCLDVIEAVQAEQSEAELEFSKFPLGKQKARMAMHTDEIQLLVAYVWEWLMRSVFGSDQCREIIPNQLLDLWLDEDTASNLKILETRIFASQKATVAHEWRSFTIQCLAEKATTKGSPRMKKVMEEVSSWLLPMSYFDEKESKVAIQKLLTGFQESVVVPAIEFSKILRQRFTPIFLWTPELLEDAVEHWYKIQFDEGDIGPELEIVIRPQLCRTNVGAASGENAKIEVLVEAEKFKMVDLNDSVENKSSNSCGGEDQIMSDD